ncbi:MAG: TraR/DksA family transcriptional regulator [Segetibacter sp.]|nr:TraR/DksA family transcriptional regulator [Segetibacter sp.]
MKKTLSADKNDSKVVAPKKEATTEKKSKANAPVEKEAKKASAKASKSEGESEKAKPVVIPKTSTDKKVDYEPDFLKSVLDTPATTPNAPTMRYSDSELQEFRDLIGKKLDAAKKELAYLQGLITRRDEMGGDETDNRYMTMEDGGMSMEREQLSQMASRQITFIDHLEKAIMRIENKTYGICRVTGKLIDKARLRAVPHATLSMEAKLGITK